MALTANQQTLLNEIVRQQATDDIDGLGDAIGNIIGKPEAQIITGLKQFAAQRAQAETDRLAAYDANRQGIVDSIAWYTQEAQ